MQLLSHRPRTQAVVGGLVLCAAALALPVTSFAQWLASETKLDFDVHAQGVWIWKLATLLLGILWIAADAFRARGIECEPLLLRGRSTHAPQGMRMQALVAAICCVGLALRLHALDDGLWFDEIDTLVRYADASLVKAVASFETQNNHLGYSLLANLSVQVFGADAWGLRLPAVLLGALSLWATWRFALLIAPPTEALFATLLLAVSWHHVWFSQDARGYTGMLLATLISTGIFLRMLWQVRASGMKLPVCYALAASAGVWMHVTAVFVVVAHFLIWSVLAIRKPGAGENRLQPLWGFVLSAALSLWLYALVLPQLLDTLGGPSMPGQETQWRNPLWMLRETLDGLARAVPGGYLALAEGVFLIGLGVWSYGRQSLLLLALFFLPAALTCAVILLQGHNLWPRFFFSSAAFGVLVVLRGVFEFVGLFTRIVLASHRKLIGNSAACLLCLASAATLPRVYGPKQDFEGAAAWIQANAPAGSVATLEMGTLPFLEHLRLPWARITDLQTLVDFEREHPETWVVMTTPVHLAAVQPETWTRLETEYREERVFQGSVRGGEIVVKVRRAP